MQPVLTDLGFVCSLGTTPEEVILRLQKGKDSNFDMIESDVPNEKVPFFSVTIPDKHVMRCYSLLDAALNQLAEKINSLKKQYYPERLGIVLGTSNTGIHEAQQQINIWMDSGKCPDDFSFEEIELGSPTLYVQKTIGFEGPCYTISTACSSSAKAFASARRLLEEDICDAILVGGVDSHCMFAQNGFFALNALSLKKTQPFSEHRDGINLGEGAALFIMQKTGSGIVLKGVGESSDGYDLTHPDPSGHGAIQSMKLALKDANLSTCQIDYINMHGTGTAANDLMEGRAIYELFGDKALCASTKALTGHTLGAAGAIEAALSWFMLKHQFIIPHMPKSTIDPTIPHIALATGTEKRHLLNILSNSFAFGGSNVSLIFGVNDG